MAAEIKTILWLQWKLMLTVFRSRRADSRARLGRLVLALLITVSVLPFFAFAGAGLAYVLASISPAAGVELVVMVNTGMFAFWLLVPASYNQDVIERLDLTRLFPHPVSLRGIAAGTALASLFSPMGLGTALVLAGEVLGLAWHAPLLLPLILAGAAAVMVFMALAGRLMEDVFDLVAGDRRLRGLYMFFLMMPFFVLLIGSYAVQVLLADGPTQAKWLRPLLGDLPSLEGLSPIQGVDVLLRHFHASSVLAWLPTGWASAGMARPVAGQFLSGLACLLLGLALGALMLRLHGRIIRRMMEGGALHLGASQVRDARMVLDLPGPRALWTLVAKDWTCIRRSPLTKQVLLGSPLLLVVFGFTAWQLVSLAPAGSALRLGGPYVAGAVLLVSVNLAMINLTCDYFGAIDREGFSGMVLAPLDPRLVLAAQGLVTGFLTLLQTLVLLLLVAAVTGSWIVVPWGLFVGLLLHVSTLPVYNLVGILSPYRAAMTFSRQNQGNVWMVLAWVIGSVPALALGVIPVFAAPAALLFTLPLAALYAGGLYALTLRPLSRLMLSRAYQINEVVSREA